MKHKILNDDLFFLKLVDLFHSVLKHLFLILLLDIFFFNNGTLRINSGAVIAYNQTGGYLNLFVDDKITTQY